MAFLRTAGSARFISLPRALVAFAFAAATLTTEPPAHACSGLPCVSGDVFPTAGTVPSNALVWFVRSPRCNTCDPDAGALEDSLRFERDPGVDAGSNADMLTLVEDAIAPERPNDANLRYTPVLPLDPGTVLHVERFDACLRQTVDGEILVTDPEPAPTTLGTTEVTTAFGPLNLETFSGSCTQATNSHYADVTVALAPEALPYADVLRYRLLVDGSFHSSDDWPIDDLWPVRGIGGSVHGRGLERVYAVCDTSNPDAIGSGVSPGPHLVQLQALLPDDSIIESDAVEIDLSCPTCGGEAGPSCAAGDGGIDGSTLLPDASAPVGSQGPDVPDEAGHPDASGGTVRRDPDSGPLPGAESGPSSGRVDASSTDRVRDAGPSDDRPPTNRAVAETGTRGCNCVVGRAPDARGFAWVAMGVFLGVWGVRRGSLRAGRSLRPRQRTSRASSEPC